MGGNRSLSLKRRVTTLCRRVFRPSLSRRRLEKEDMSVGHGKPELVPKGYLAVYVGQKGGDFQRILVPVVHFNHPLFEDLLKESENEYGFDQPGGLAILCQISEFERIQTRIKTVQCTRKWKTPSSNL